VGVQLVDDHEARRQAVRQRRVGRDHLQIAAVRAQLGVAARDALLEVGAAADHPLRDVEQQPRLVPGRRARVNLGLLRRQQPEQAERRQQARLAVAARHRHQQLAAGREHLPGDHVLERLELQPAEPAGERGEAVSRRALQAH
jgi:hypothetical protein